MKFTNDLSWQVTLAASSTVSMSKNMYTQKGMIHII